MKSQTSHITVALPKRLLLIAKKMAEKRGVSLSKLLVELLVRIVDRHEVYQEAKRKSLALLRKPPNLGTKGRITWTRDELHERR